MKLPIHKHSCSRLTIKLFLLFLIGTQALSGQERITVKAGEDIHQVISTGRYLFPEFQKARVFLKNESTEANMNYNALSGKMEFIDASGEVMALQNNVQAVVIQGHFFKYTHKGYMEILADNSNFELLVHRKFSGGDIKKVGAYGTTSSATSSNTYSHISTDLGLTSLTLAQEQTYTKTNTYYVYSNGKYRLANKSTFTKLFGKLKPDIENYLKNTPVNFSKEEELIDLFIYCTSHKP